MYAERKFGLSVTEGVQIGALIVAALVGTCNFVNSLYFNLATKAHQPNMLQETVHYNRETREVANKTYEMTKNHNDRMFQVAESNKKSLDALDKQIDDLWQKMRSQGTQLTDVRRALERINIDTINRKAHLDRMEAEMSSLYHQAAEMKTLYEKVERQRGMLQASIDSKAADDKEQLQAMVEPVVMNILEDMPFPWSEADIERIVSQVTLRMQYVHQRQSGGDVVAPLNSSV